ncbi:hypothetical protein DRH14_01840 [Candidatus Shapirobacteria bacterium]|nr:MAG: hypothetical protein DRH14_01840 [Candidatus Shapirobacteria bacterium]
MRKLTKYETNVLVGLLAIMGSYLIGEHLYTWHRIDWGDWIGHETYGFILIASSIILYILNRKRSD